jgi:hypothetical protein
MSNLNNWTDERLDRLATDTEQNTSSISELRISVEALLQVAQIHQLDIEAMGRDTQGLKLEMRRLVEELRENRGQQ